MKQEIQCTFVACGQKEGKKPWIRLSDGIESVYFDTNLDLQALKDLKRGEEVTVEMEINPFSRYGTKVVAIS